MSAQDLPKHLILYGPPVSPKIAARRLSTDAIGGEFTPEALHTYTDRQGRPVYWRIRARLQTGEKWIRPMSVNGMVYSLAEPEALANGPKPLYRLHEIAKADPAVPIWFVEGECCADKLVKLALVATTGGGAQSDEKLEVEALRGRNVILWPDNDHAGREHMQRMAVKLVALGCRVETVQIDVLGMPEHGDVVDYMHAHPGATAADLMALARIRVELAPECHSDESIELIRGDAVKVEPVRWLWDGWLARGKLHILAGAPGTGKTTLALAMAATITSGGQWPDGSRAEVGSVLIWSGEDDPADTLAPRLLAMVANMERVHFVGSVADEEGRRPFDPATDMRALMARAAEIGDVRLLIVDPIVNAVAGDSHKNGEVRRALAPVVEVATALDCAALGISHFTKGTAGRDPVERVTGSLAFGALARVVLAAARVKEDDGSERRLFARAKSNIGPDGGGFSYALEQIPVRDHPGISASRVTWGAPIEGTARELLATAEADQDSDGDSSADVEAFVRGCLADGPVSAKHMQADANGAGHSWDRVKRAANRLGVDRRKDGMRGGWIWAMPGARSAKESTEGSEGSKQKCLHSSHSSALPSDEKHPPAPHTELGAGGGNGAVEVEV